MISQTHDLRTVVYAGSKMLERLSYYGFRALLVLYMIEFLKLPNDEAFRNYTWFLRGFIFTFLLGGILGDFFLNNKRALLVGGILQAAGAFSLCIQSEFGLYLGLGLILIGNGLYTPNVFAQFGKIYSNKKNLLDAGFTIVYMAINIGAFAGPMLISRFRSINYQYGFALCGAIMLLSILLPLLITERTETNESTQSISINKRINYMLIAIFASGIYWVAYEFYSVWTFDLEKIFDEIGISPINIWTFLFPLIMCVGIIAAVIWTIYHYSSFVKMAFGFMFAAVAIGLILIIPEAPSAVHVKILFASFFIYAIAEILVGPIVYSIIAQYANPRFLATMMALALVPFEIFRFILQSLNILPGNDLHLTILMVIVLLSGALLFLLYWKNRDEMVNDDKSPINQ